MGFLPADTPIQHRVWSMDGGTDRHGNPTGSWGAPINRMVIAWFPYGVGLTGTDPISPDVMERVENDITILVDDASIYNKLDLVIVNGLVYQVQGVPANWSTGLPFPTAAYGALVGGQVHARRVTSTGVLQGQ